jgi:ABC-type multidrug transport system ATPase subunit
MSDPRLAVQDLRKTYRGGFGLHGVSFDVPAGTIVALGGHNGSGKSTLLRCVAGLSRFEGSVRIDGHEIGGRPTWRRAIGYLPQLVSFPEHVTVGEVLDLFARLRDCERDALPLPDGFVRDDDERIGALSGGQRHRVALAASLMGTPRLLLLDEPIANLDEEGRAAFWEVVRNLRDRDGVTAIVSSPAPSELLGVADRAITLDDGRISVDQSADEIRQLHPVRVDGVPEIELREARR